jgi:putative Holliday junction resolvase
MTSSSDSGAQSAADVPREGRLLGLDYGTQRVGIALSTPEQNLASPLENYTRFNPDADAAFLRELVNEYRIVGLVVGLPVHMSGDEGQKAGEAREYGKWAAAATGLPVTWWDERYTTLLAEEALISAGLSKKKRKQRLDKLAAQIMLQAFLDRRLAKP